MTRSTYPFHSHGCNHLWVGEALVNHFEFNHSDDTGDDASDDYENDTILIQLSIPGSPFMVIWLLVKTDTTIYLENRPGCDNYYER